jgi:hypothetical protein
MASDSILMVRIIEEQWSNQLEKRANDEIAKLHADGFFVVHVSEAVHVQGNTEYPDSWHLTIYYQKDGRNPNEPRS